LHESGNLDDAQVKAFGEALWARLEVAGLPAGFVRLHNPVALLRLPGAPENLGLRLREILFAQLFPSTDGTPGTARENAEERALQGFRWLSQYLRSERARLSPAEGQGILRRAPVWIAAHQARPNHQMLRRSAPGHEDPLLREFVEFLAEHVLPALESLRPDTSAALASLLDALKEEPVSTLRLAFDLQRLGVLDADEARRDLLVGVRSPDEAVVDAAVWAVLRWYERGAKPPRAALRE
jgi:hypothetical protein